MALLPALGCGAMEEYNSADLQLDLPGAITIEAENVRVCVAGVGQREFGARLLGRFAFTGVPAGEPVDVTVDVLDPDGELLLQGFGAGVEGWAEGESWSCDGDCTPCEEEDAFAQPGEDSWLLTVRFLD